MMKKYDLIPSRATKKILRSVKLSSSFLQMLFLMVSIGFHASTYGQCPGSPSVTAASQTAATCPSNGSVVLGGNGVANANVIYKIVAAPNSSYINTSQPGTQNTFSNLESGTYTIEMSCVGSPELDSVTFSIADQYTAPGAAVTVSDLCQGASPGGTITLSNVAGSSVPLQYAFFQTNDVNVPDNQLTYGPATSFTATSFGNYIVRIKDQCGAIITYPVSIASPGLYSPSSINMPASFVNCDTMQSTIYLVPPGGGYSSVAPTGGITINVYLASSISPCTKSTLYSSVYYPEGTDLLTIPFKFPAGQNFVTETVNSCGQTGTLACTTVEQTAGLIAFNIENASCNTVADTINLLHNYTNNLSTPVSYCLYDGNTQLGCNSDPGASLFLGLPTSGHNYKIIATDICGRSDTLSITTPSGGFVLTLGQVDRNCTSLDKVNVKIDVSGNVPKASQVVPTIISGPCCIGQTASGSGGVQGGYFYFDGLIPGTYEYVLDYTPAAGCSPYPDTFEVIVPPLQFTFDINGTVNQVCGGLASITSLFQFSHSTFTDNIHLKTLSGNTVDSNSSGSFNNVAAGTYVLEFTPYSTDCNTDFGGIAARDTVVVLPPNTPPVAAKKFGFICEDPSGAPLTTGSALFDINGFGPYDVYYSTSNVQPANPQLTAQANPITISSLNANTTYYFWFKDQCGNVGAVTQLSIGQLGALPINQSLHPCDGDPYSLAMNEYPSATYEWKKGSTIVSGTREYLIPNYNSSYNGTYTGTMVLNGCLTRTVTMFITDSMCSMPLPLQLVSFTVNRVGSMANVQWTTSEEQKASHFDIERNEGKTNVWSKVGKVVAEKSSSSNYQFRDQNPLQGWNYYRLKIVDADGKFRYSPIRSVQFDLKGAGFQLYPNPAHGIATLVQPGIAAEGSQLKVYNLVGQELSRQSISGKKIIDINTSLYAPGTYLIVVTDGSSIVFKEKLVCK